MVEPSFRLMTGVPQEGPSLEAGSVPSSTATTATTASTADALDDTQVLAAFRKALLLDPAEADYHYVLGDALLRLGRPREALPALEEAVRLSSRDPQYHCAHGLTLSRLGRYEQAANAFKEALRVRPDHVEALNGYAVALVELKCSKEAVSVLHRAIRVSGRDGRLYGNLAVALWQLRKHTEALRAFRRAVELNPRSAEIHDNLGLALAASGKAEEALASFHQALRLRPDDPHPRLDLGEVLYALGRRAEAGAAIDEALRLHPGCLAERPASQAVREALLLERLRGELRPDAPLSGLSALAWACVFAVGHVLRSVLSFAGGLGRGAGLLLLPAMAYEAWVFVPPYLTHYQLADKMVEIGRAPVGDEDILDRLMHAVREHGLEAHVHPDSFRINTGPKWRTIVCEYDVPARILPGFERKLRFRARVEEPYLRGSDR